MIQMPVIENSIEQIRVRAKQNPASRPLPWLVLLLRVALFYLFGLTGTGVFMLLGYPDPMKEITRWWSFQVILANIACFFILKALTAKEKIRFRDLLGYNRATIKKSIIFILITLVPSCVVALGGMWGSQFLLYGNAAPPEIFYQPLPFVAALVMLVFFPASNALIETTTYFGYSLQRIEAQGTRTIVAVIITSFFLALQHIAIPMFFDTTYILWRLLGFLPLSLFTSFVFSRIRQLPPMMAVHFLADMGTALPVFIASIG